MNFIDVLLFYQSDIKKEKYIFKFSVYIKKKKYYFVFVSHKTIINNTV